MVALGDVVEVKGGGTPSKANPAFWNGDIPWVSPKDMKCWNIEDAEDKITADAIKGSATNLIPRSSILIVNRSGILKHTLPVGITRRPVAINQDIKALICGPRSHPDYIAHLIKAAEPVILKWVRATTADNFPIETLRSLEVPLPPLDEQRRIAAILDTADALRRERKRAFALLGKLTDALIAELLDAPKSIDLGEIIVEGPTNGLYKPSKDYGEGVPILRINSFYDGKIVDLLSLRRLSVTDSELSRFKLTNDDIVINRVNSLEYLGKSAIVRGLMEPTVYESNMMRFSVKKSIMLPEVCIALLQTPDTKRQILAKAKNAVNQSSINQRDVCSLHLALPAMEIQRKFVARTQRVAALVAIASASEASINTLFSSLQSRAFSGQL